MIHAPIYPGMISSDIEIFNHQNQTMAIANGEVINYDLLPYGVLERIKELLHRDPAALAQVREWHPDSEFQQVKKFASCRFGGLDFTPDLGNGCQTGEYWDCPMRGSCAGEGVVCRNVSYNGHEITPQDVILIKAISTNKTNEVIAQEMGVPFGSFHGIKTKLYRKFDNAQTKLEVIQKARHLNIT